MVITPPEFVIQTLTHTKWLRPTVQLLLIDYFSHFHQPYINLDGIFWFMSENNSTACSQGQPGICWDEKLQFLSYWI